MPISSRQRLGWALACTLLIAACGGGGGGSEPPIQSAATNNPPPTSQPVATPEQTCAALISFNYPSTQVTGASLVAAGLVAGIPAGEHCLVAGRMNARTGQNGNYAIRFELRLPTAWNGRFYFQGNGGFDGTVVPAVGYQLGGGPTSHALGMGFAVISSDAGHTEAQIELGAGHFGLDPQARRDYGYQAIGTLTPMARALVQAAYGRAPDHSYIGGCSNGGRQALVAAARYPEWFDGYLVGSPGLDMPRTGLQMLWETQQLASVAPGKLADGRPDVSTALSAAERRLISGKIVERCDWLDGAVDGMVLDTRACQVSFDLQRDVPSCSGARDGSCLTGGQKTALLRMHGGARDSAGQSLHGAFGFDRGIAEDDWAAWKFTINTGWGASAVPYLFTSPPRAVAWDGLLDYALGFSMDRDAGAILSGGGAFPDAAVAYMTVPGATALSGVKQRGGKILVTHGTGDPIFPADQTATWYDDLRATHGGDASGFARYFPVPGMGHCGGGPATDHFNALQALVDWVEQSKAPDAIVASVRGASHAGGANASVPAHWSAQRTRPLCAWPKVPRLKAGATDLESAASFSCQ